MPRPLIMVAPNGARRDKTQHPALPLTIAETAQTAAECADAGADAIHAHIRDAQGAHSLDAGLYRELLAALAERAPTLDAQITTESAGVYDAGAQRRLIVELAPPWVSVALREMLSDKDTAAAQKTYHQAAEAGVRVQHILYTPEDILSLRDCLARGIIPTHTPVETLLVLGRYASDSDSGTPATPSMLPDYLRALKDIPAPVSFMVCAFGIQETACLCAAASAGGDCRIGFENNLHHPDGSIAASNADRVRQLRGALAASSN